jgi:HD domain/Hpt domain
MDIAALIQPRIRDVESLQEFYDALADYMPNIERYIALLRRAPKDKVLIADLFRALHSIKGDAALCKIDMAEIIAQPIETVLARLRSEEIAFSDVLAEAILLASDRLWQGVEALENGQRSLGHLKLVQLVEGFEEMAAVPANKIDEKSADIIEAVTGFRPANAAPAPKPHVRPAVVSNSENATADLNFFHSLALQYEGRAQLLKGRSDRQLLLALDTNEVAGNPVDPAQLKAAVFMHDIGMMFLPEALWTKTGRISDEEKLLLRTHPGFGSGLLARMPGWQLAAEIVLQHHEMPDGRGYPQGLKGNEINDGAKIMAIVDTFEAVTLRQSQHGGTRSMLRAIAEINACDNQFDARWIDAFNVVVRRMIEE